MKLVESLIPLWCAVAVAISANVAPSRNKYEIQEAIDVLEEFVNAEHDPDSPVRFKRDAADRGVTNLDIRDAILQLLNVIRDGNKKLSAHENKQDEVGEQILKRLNVQSGKDSVEKKIDNISTFLLRMYSKMDQVDRYLKKSARRSGGGGGGGASDEAMITLAQESFDILTLLPTYIENTRKAVTDLTTDTNKKFELVESLLVDDSEDAEVKNKSLAKVMKSTEEHILNASNELKNIVIESGNMAESLFERVNDGYTELTEEIKGLSNVEKVLMDTADSVMENKRKIEFGVQQIIFKVEELVQGSGGEMDEQLKGQFADITRTILSNQTEALGNLTKKVEKEIGQVWRQMGIMYGQVSNSIKILERVKSISEGYVNNTSKNLGTMEGTVEGLTDRMVDVDSNLNYMLGQLSLVVQEFNQVKTGLSEAMNGISDEIQEYKPEEE